MNERMNERVNERMNEQMNERMNERMNVEPVNERLVNEVSTYECTDEWPFIYERTNEQYFNNS